MEIKNKLIKCMDNGYYVLHEERGNIDVKNLLSTNVVILSDVTSIIKRARDKNYSCSTHHLDDEVDVHQIKATHSSRDMYV